MADKTFITKDSGQRQEFGTGSVRDLATGKGRYDLIPTLALRRLAGLYERGAAKYGDRNWEKGQPLMRYIDSAMRHLNCLLAGEPEEDHAAAVMWNMAGYMHTLAQIEAGRLPAELDNRPPVEPQYDAPRIDPADITTAEEAWFARGPERRPGGDGEDLTHCDDPHCTHCPTPTPRMEG